MVAVLDVSPAVTVTTGTGRVPVPFYEAVWHEPQESGRAKPAKQRIGKAWLEVDSRDDRGRVIWRKRKGRVPEGFFDERRAMAAASDAVKRYRDRRASRAQPSGAAVEQVTVRGLAHEWHSWLADVRGASPATVQDYGYLLREAGLPARRGDRVSAGRLMKAFGDRTAASVTERDVGEWLRDLAHAGLTPRNVNKHRQMLGAIYTYGCRSDTHALERNPVSRTDKRREPPPARLDYFEPYEVELLAQAAAAGAHRKAPNYKGRLTTISDAERAMRAQQDAQDAELFRILLYTGPRIGEALALRWIDMDLVPELDGGVLDIRHAVSANVEKPPKSWKPRTVPVPRPAAEAFGRLALREHFTEPDDYVFVNRLGRRLDPSAIRRRYKAAREKAGLREITLHGLRHAAGSILAEGAGLLTARDILGHAHVSTTNRYLSGKTDRRAIAVVNAAFEGRGGQGSSSSDDGTVERAAAV